MCDLRTLRSGEHLVHLLSLTHSSLGFLSYCCQRTPGVLSVVCARCLDEGFSVARMHISKCPLGGYSDLILVS